MWWVCIYVYIYAEEKKRGAQLSLAPLYSKKKTKPMWQDRAFCGEFGDAYVENTELEGGHIAPSLKVLWLTVKMILKEHKSWFNDYTEQDFKNADKVFNILTIGKEISQQVRNPL